MYCISKTSKEHVFVLAKTINERTCKRIHTYMFVCKYGHLNVSTHVFARFAFIHCAIVASAIKILCNIGEQFASLKHFSHTAFAFHPCMRHGSRRLMLTVDNEYKMNVSNICEITAVLYHFVSFKQNSALTKHTPTPSAARSSVECPLQILLLYSIALMRSIVWYHQDYVHIIIIPCSFLALRSLYTVYPVYI